MTAVSGEGISAISGNNLRNQAEFSVYFKFSWQERLLRASQLTKPRFLGVKQRKISFPRADCPAPSLNPHQVTLEQCFLLARYLAAPLI